MQTQVKGRLLTVFHDSSIHLFCHFRYDLFYARRVNAAIENELRERHPRDFAAYRIGSDNPTAGVDRDADRACEADAGRDALEIGRGDVEAADCTRARRQVAALDALGKINFDLILCDINMPNLDGFKLVEFMNTKNIFIPIIFMTIREDVEDEIRGLALGAKDYIRKPVNRDLLLLRIRKALNK